MRKDDQHEKNGDQAGIDRMAINSAPPPLHAAAIVAVASSVCVTTLPTIESIDEDATIDAFCTPMFVGLSPRLLACIRLFFAFLIIITTLFWAKGTTLIPTYLPGSQLRPTPIYLRGWRSLTPFTCVSWMVLGFAFLVSGSVPLVKEYGYEEILVDNPWILRAALILFEIAAPSSLLVAFVVTYAIWPRVLREDGEGSTAALKSIPVLLMHNANVVMVLLEVGLLGKVPFRLGDASLAPLYGLGYVLFSWFFMAKRWASPQHGPQFIYFFMDTTLGWTTTIALLALLAVQLSSYGLFVLADDLVELSCGVGGRFAFICLLSYFFCRFRD